jgi:NADH-quinone oxidoreductase subunit A
VGQYLPIFAMLVLAIIFAVVSRVVSQLLAPRRPSEAKSSPYECGIVPDQGPPERFPVKFFLVAMIFIVFDIEIIFLFPFAVVFRSLGWYGIAAILIFTAAVFESFVYLIGNGALDWASKAVPPKRLHKCQARPGPQADSSSPALKDSATTSLPAHSKSS